LVIWLLFALFSIGMPPATALLFPLILLPLTALVMGLSWLLAALGVYLRDVTHITGICVTMLLFLTPLFYPVAAIPERYRPFIYGNPLTVIVEASRDLLIFGRLPAWPPLLLVALATLFLSWGGFAWFQKTRKGFADVL
ncbi:MAG: ABC transporter permease, partial [Nitrosomonas sp.]|nr:ABC transporter permease [Nitrosomonas sp.]